MSIFKIVISVLFGLIPEALFFTFFLIFTKNIKEKKIKLFALVSISYFIYIILAEYKVINYMIFVMCIYISLKILYKKKTQIIDIFIISYAFLYISLLAYISFIFVNNNLVLYYIFYCLDRILLFIPFIFRNKLNKLYKIYCKYWNRNDKEHRPIKSITLRNVSLIIVNLAVFILNIAILNIT